MCNHVVSQVRCSTYRFSSQPSSSAYKASSPFKGGAGVKESVERFQCSECSKSYSFLHKLQHHQLWGCKKKKQEEQLDFARRPSSSNVFSFTTNESAEDSNDHIASRVDVAPRRVKLCVEHNDKLLT